MKSFQPLMPTECGCRRPKYFVFGKIFYWFVIIHRQIPYSTDINPAIIAYAICEKIPRNVLPHIDGSVNSLVQQILSYNSQTSQEAIDTNVKDCQWLHLIGIPLSDFMNDLQNPEKGPGYLADTIATLAVVNDSAQAFAHFHQGFNDNRGFETVKPP